MNKKQQDMMRYLSHQTKPMTSNEIANALNLSSRSIKNYVHEINDYYGKNIISSSRNGYSLNDSFRSNLLISLDEDQVPQTLEDRAFYIIKQLILNRTASLELFDLCDSLYISYSTIKSVISKMNKMFSSYQVEFYCENNCVHIKGTEHNKRKLIGYVINEESKTSYLNTEILQNNFKEIDVNKLQSIIFTTFKKHNYYLNDFAAANLILHLLIIIDRELNGNVLQSGESELDINSNQEKKLLDDLIDQLKKTFKIDLNVYEIFEIFMLFKANANCSLNDSTNDLRKIVGDDILSLVNEYVSKINNLYMLDLSNSSFTTPFALHLKNLIFRAKAKQSTKNPMVQAIKKNSPVVFDIAIYIAIDLMNQFDIDINEDETSFLAMHIGAEIERQEINKSKIPTILVCPNYHETAKNIFNALMLNFGNQINILDTVPNEYELSEELISQTSIIFTTIPLSVSTPSTTILNISPINLASQFELIQTTITRQKEQYKDYKLKINFRKFFEEDLFIVNPNLQTKQQVLTYLCDTLISKSYVDSDFESKVYQREKAATTAFGHVAIPHSVDMNAIKTSISVAISKKGFQWDSNIVNVVFLLAINKADKQNFRYLYESLISLFSDDEIIQEVKNCKQFKDFENLIYSKIQSKDDE